MEDKIPENCENYYITGAGRIWGVKNSELLDGDAQKRRDILGNSFKTPEEAALRKAQLEAFSRLKPYTERKLCMVDGLPSMIFKFHLPIEKESELKNDIILLSE